MYQVCLGHEKFVSSCPRRYASNSTREMMRHIQCRFVSSCPRRYASKSIRVHVSNSTDGAYMTCSLQALAQQDAGPWFLSVTQPREPIWLVHYKHMPTHIGPCFLSVTQPREPMWHVNYKHMPTNMGPCFLSVTQPREPMWLVHCKHMPVKQVAIIARPRTTTKDRGLLTPSLSVPHML